MFGMGGDKKAELRKKVNEEITDNLILASQKKSEMNDAQAQLDKDMSNLKITMDILSAGVKDQIDDIEMLLASGDGE